ncbi:MAG: LptF/LptG family permease [Chitinophagales bacterium]|nr:LptF/LptG family permease [Chitinophagales bacterium]
MLKKIDRLIAGSFIGPAILSYFIATFVLIMQFLWKYIDEILGKGLSILEMIELIFYYAVTLIPMAVPITVLISSVMVFGDMAEKYELSSLKSAGISLIRIMLPGVIIACLIGVFSIISANYLKPAALLQFNKRFISIRKQKSSLAIEEGIFNDAFDETIIRVSKIDKNKKDIHDVLIYDHTGSDKSLIRLTTAKSGQMFTAQEGRYFVMELDSGVNYQELDRRTNPDGTKVEMPFNRMYFDKWKVAFDMSVFSGDDGFLNISHDREQMMNSLQLLKSIDSFSNRIRENNGKVADQVSLLMAEFSNPSSIPNPSKKEIQPSLPIKPQLEEIRAARSLAAKLQQEDAPLADTSEIQPPLPAGSNESGLSPPELPKAPTKKIVKQEEYTDLNGLKYWVLSVDSIDFRQVINKAQSNLSGDRDATLNISSVNADFDRIYNKYMLRLNQQYSWAVICIIFLFIGAPLGSIIRKGGYGYPLLVAILFYMMFIISTIFGEKLVRSSDMSGLQAAWIPCLILLPWAILLTIMALRDVKFNPGIITSFFTKLLPKKWVKKEEP